MASSVAGPQEAGTFNCKLKQARINSRQEDPRCLALIASLLTETLWRDRRVFAACECLCQRVIDLACGSGSFLVSVSQVSQPLVSEQPTVYNALEAEPTTEVEVRQAIASRLRSEVAAMNLNNFIVRPQRDLVETYADPNAWNQLQTEQMSELANRVAGLPTELPSEDEEAKRFDLLMLRLQLARLRAEPGFVRLSQQVKAIA